MCRDISHEPFLSSYRKGKADRRRQRKLDKRRLEKRVVDVLLLQLLLLIHTVLSTGREKKRDPGCGAGVRGLSVTEHLVSASPVREAVRETKHAKRDSVSLLKGAPNR